VPKLETCCFPSIAASNSHISEAIVAPRWLLVAAAATH